MKRKINLDQDTLDRAHKRLQGLIDVTNAARIAACNEGLVDARDTLDRVQAHLCMARAEAGSLDLGGDIRPKSGGK